MELDKHVQVSLSVTLQLNDLQELCLSGYCWACLLYTSDAADE